MRPLRRSFRLRIALLVALLSGTILATFGTLLWWHLRQSGIVRIDQEMAEIATRHLDFFMRHAVPGRKEVPPWFYGGEFRDTHVWAHTASGKDVYRSAEWPAEIRSGDLPAPPDSPRMPQGHPALPDTVRPINRGSVQRDGHTWRLGTVSQDGLHLHVALDLTLFEDQMGKTAGAIGMALTLALAIAGLGGWWLAGRALKPVLAVTRSAEHITATGLSERIQETTQAEEFARLVHVYNAMLSRLEQSFEQAARFSADAAHELRTPLAIMQGQVETTLREVDEESPAAAALVTQLEEVHRLKGLVHRLLLLSRADRGALLNETTSVDLSALTLNAAEDADSLAEDLTCTHAVAEGVHIDADEGLVELALGNLVSNAVKYNQPDGTIHIELEQDAQRATVRIANTGPPIEGHEQQQIFDRFHRADQARSRKVDGTGLGLSLANEIAVAHRGELVLESSENGVNVFALRLPR